MAVDRLGLISGPENHGFDSRLSVGAQFIEKRFEKPVKDICDVAWTLVEPERSIFKKLCGRKQTVSGSMLAASKFAKKVVKRALAQTDSFDQTV
ncbi:hypothetical protein KNO81_31290 [Paraburkholderia sediminicola]|nr:hypothetical protein [Paraburkholderia sediminicola]